MSDEEELPKLLPHFETQLREYLESIKDMSEEKLRSELARMIGENVKHADMLVKMDMAICEDPRYKKENPMVFFVHFTGGGKKQFICDTLEQAKQQHDRCKDSGCCWVSEFHEWMRHSSLAKGKPENIKNRCSQCGVCARCGDEIANHVYQRGLDDHRFIPNCSCLP